MLARLFRTASLLAGVSVVWATHAAAQTSVDSALYSYIQRIRAIDNHAHPVSTDPNDHNFDALPLEGIPPFDFPARLHDDNPELVKAWAELYGYSFSDLSEEHLKEVVRLKAAAKSEHGDGYPSWVLDKLGIEIQLANRMALGPGIAPPRFRWVSFVDPLLFPISTKGLQTTPDRADLFPRTEKHLREYLGDLHLSTLPATLDGYLKEVVTATLERMKQQGAVAIKYEVAYLRRLDFGPATLTDARAIYSRYRAGGAPSQRVYQPLQDYLFRYIGREAGRLGLVVHIHSADGAGGYYEASGSDPILLESALNDTTLRHTRFVIVHGGWPHPRNTMSLFAKTNVYADFSFLGNLISSNTLASVLREWLSGYPNRILFGTDAYQDSPVVGWEEWGWLGATAGRKALAIALTGMMRDGEITRERAEEIARMVLHDNAAALYHFSQ